jgi:hypothetical protein
MEENPPLGLAFSTGSAKETDFGDPQADPEAAVIHQKLIAVYLQQLQ